MSARAADAAPPEITAHSQLEFAVRKGDTVAVEVKAKGDGLVYKWVRSEQTFCREAACEFDTSDWGLGTHRVTLVVYNELGSLFLKFRVRILTVPAGYAPARLTAPLVETDQAVESVRRDDFVVHAEKGRGYSYHLKKVQVVGPTPRVLTWDEKLRAQADGTMVFGREGHERHVLTEGSSVYLVTGESRRRALVLREGVLRSRQLSPTAPEWSIIAEPWLQIDTNEIGDVLVERRQGDSDVVTVTVLRGAARVFQEGKAVTVGQGLELVLTRGDTTPPKVVQPDAKRVSKLFEETTPEYMPGQDPTRVGDGWTIAGDKRPETAEDALKLAREATKKRDYMLALEMLAARTKMLKYDPDGALVLGEAAFGLSLLGPATAALERAVELKPEAPEPHYLMGYLALTGKAWAQAVKELEAADDLGYPGQQELQYYLGVARLNAGKRLGARQAFSYALWEKGAPEVETSARAFLRTIEDDTWLDLRFGAGVFYDTNLLRSDDVDPATVGNGEIDANRAPGYFGSMGFSVFGFRGRGGHAAVTFDIEQRSYLGASLAALGTLDQKLAVDLAIALGGDAKDPARVAIGIAPFLRMIYQGEERAVDQVGSVISLGSPAMLGLELRVESAFVSDPLPGRDDVMDPILGEMVTVGDRSGREVAYGLKTTPLDNHTWRMGIDVRRGTTVMGNPDQLEYGHQDLGIGLSASVRSTLRQSFGARLTRLTREFPDSEDGRKDARLGLHGDWTFHYTPALKQSVELGYETNTSDRDLMSYKRQVLQVGVDLDL